MFIPIVNMRAQTYLGFQLFISFGTINLPDFLGPWFLDSRFVPVPKYVPVLFNIFRMLLHINLYYFTMLHCDFFPFFQLKLYILSFVMNYFIFLLKKRAILYFSVNNQFTDPLRLFKPSTSLFCR